MRLAKILCLLVAFQLFGLVTCKLVAQANLVGNTVKINSIGGVYCESADIDTLHLRTLPARISAHITVQGETTTNLKGVYYFLNATFHNDNNVSFANVGDTLQYKNGNYKYLVGVYSFTVGADQNSTTIETAIFKNDDLVEGSESLFESKTTAPIGKVTGCFMLRVMTDDRIKIMVKSNKTGAVITTYFGTTWMHQIY